MLPHMVCFFGELLCPELREKIYAFLSIQTVYLQNSFNRAVHKATWKVKEVYYEVITTVPGGNPLAEKIQKGFDKEAAV